MRGFSFKNSVSENVNNYYTYQQTSVGNSGAGRKKPSSGREKVKFSEVSGIVTLVLCLVVGLLLAVFVPDKYALIYILTYFATIGVVVLVYFVWEWASKGDVNEWARMGTQLLAGYAAAVGFLLLGAYLKEGTVEYLWEVFKGGLIFLGVPAVAVSIYLLVGSTED